MSIKLKASQVLIPLMLLMLTSGNAFAQSHMADSLVLTLDRVSVDTVRVRILFEIADLLQETHPDSSIALYKQAIGILNKSKFDTLKYSIRRAKALQRIGLAQRKLGNLDYALRLQQQAFGLFKNTADTLSQAQSMVYIGNINFNKGEFEVAVGSYFNALKLYEHLKNSIGIADCYNNIGSVYKEMNELQEALKYHLKSVHIFEKLALTADSSYIGSIRKGLSYGYNNMGIVYWTLNRNNEAIEYYTKSLKLKVQINDYNGVAQGYNNIAIVYATQNNNKQAIEYFKKALEVYSNTKNINGLAMVNGNIAYLYLLLAEATSGLPTKDSLLKMAISHANLSLNASKETGDQSQQLETTGYLKRIYSALGDYKTANRLGDEQFELQSQIFNAQKAEAFAEASSRYESEKKQLLIEGMEKEKLLMQKTITIQRISLALSILLMILLLSSTIVFIRFFRQKRRANSTLAIQNEEILQQKEEILTQLEEIDTKKMEIEQLYLIAVERKNILEKQREHINDSIRYAKFIQSAVLPDLQSVFRGAGLSSSSYFIMYLPKDVVSGDFYWATSKADWLVTSVSDCTGHGVPGSLMSMLGVSFLNEIVVKNNIINPAEILERLRASIISALKQSPEAGSQRDGMEMSVLAVNIKSRECIWAGAKSPLWIVRAQSDPYLEEYKPNPMPVATHVNMDSYTNHRIQLNKGDRLFLFSDGYADQFGGPEGKKFNMYKAFKRLILQTSALPMDQQHQELETNLETWMNFGGTKYEQIDDVTIMGIMIN